MKLITIWLGNLIDTIATITLYQTGMFVELNPVMAALLQNPVLFGVVKIGLISLILIKLNKEKEDRKAQIAINIGCWIYGLIALYYAILVALYLTI